MQGRFTDRAEAGRRLAERLRPFAGPEILVLALPRGGVPVGREVADALGAPLDVFLVRKIGAPGHPELAIGAIATGDVVVLNAEVLEILDISQAALDRLIAIERAELERRERLYRGGRPAPSVDGRTVILVDDGLATGASMRAAVAAVRRRGPASVLVAVPVASADAYERLRAEADEVVCALLPEPFHAVGLWYETFHQVTDDEVRALLDRPRSDHAGAADAPARGGTGA